MRKTENLKLPLWDAEDRVLRTVFNEITEKLDQLLGVQEIPVGTVMWLAAQKAPEGFLICDGAAVSRETYAQLFAVIGTTFGTGDGTTTFRLPDLRAAFIRGAGTQNGYSASFGSKQEATSLCNMRQNYALTISGEDKTAQGTAANSFSMSTGTDASRYYYFRPYNIALTPIIKC